MVAARRPREMVGLRFDRLIEVIDWNRVLIQAQGRHLLVHLASDDVGDLRVCGECIKYVLLMEE